MPRTTAALTPEQVKAKFHAAGVTITDWAKENGYDRQHVYEVLNGSNKARYGRGHEIAVKLGLKPSIPADERNPQAQRAA